MRRFIFVLKVALGTIALSLLLVILSAFAATWAWLLMVPVVALIIFVAALVTMEAMENRR